MEGIYLTFWKPLLKAAEKAAIIIIAGKKVN